MYHRGIIVGKCRLKFHMTPSKKHNFFFMIIITVLGKILERFCIGTDMLSADRFRQHRMTEK